MKTLTRIAAAVALLATSSSPAVAGLATDPVAMRAGNWKVIRSIDPMKDTVSCTGIYKEEFGIQLSPETLFIKIPGGVDTVTVRIDDFSARPFRLAGDLEKKIGSVMITGSEFSQVLLGTRLRYQVGTLVRGVATGDLDLTGIAEAMQSIRAGCPIQAPAPVVAPAPPPPAPVVAAPAPPAPVCTDAVMARMKANGVTARQMQAICKP